MESRKLALVIGNSEYEDSTLARLVTPDVDVTGLAEILRSAEIGGFDEVTALVNQPAAAIRRAISGFFVNRGRDDLLVLYFSGHGIRDDRGQLFLAVKDTESSLLRGTAIPATFITEEMDNSRSRRQVLILDCCHSGAFSQGMKGAPGSSVGTAAAFQGTGFGRVVLTATDSTQYAWEGDQVIGQAENSVFTKYLIQGLQNGKADTDGDGRITLDELYDYVYEQVVNETPRQTPSKWSYGQQGDIVIAHNPHPVPRLAALPPDLQQTIDDPRPWVREGAVRELDRLMRTSTPGLALAARAALKQLADDDSRRVASSAQASLTAPGVPAEVNLPAAAKELPAAENLPVDKLPAENLPETNKPAAVSSVAESPISTLPPVERSAPQAAEPLQAETGSRVSAGAAKSWPSAPAAQNAALEQASEMPTGEPLTGRQLLDAVLDSLADLFKGSPRKKITLVTAASAAGGVFSGIMGWNSQSWMVALFIGGLIAGLSLGLALRQGEAVIRRRYILLIAAVMAISWAEGGNFTETVSSDLGKATANAYYAVIGWNNAQVIGTNLGRLIIGLLIGGMIGFVIGLALQQAQRPIQNKTFWRIVVGWAIIWAVINVIFSLIGENTPVITSKISILALSLGLLAMLIGGLGSLYTYRQIDQDRRL